MATQMEAPPPGKNAQQEAPSAMAGPAPFIDAVGAPHPRNVWYMAGWDDDLGPGALLPMTILGEPLVLFRTASGIAAFEDRCPHRAAPLSRGRCEGDTVRCLYHGARFAADGSCVEIPGQDTIPPQLRVRTYPAAPARCPEANRFSTFTCQAVTPMTADRTCYFWAFGPQADQGDRTDFLVELGTRAFAEDLTMIEAQWRTMQATGSRVMPLAMDKALLKYDAVLKRFLAGSAAGGGQPA